MPMEDALKEWGFLGRRVRTWDSQVPLAAMPAASDAANASIDLNYFSFVGLRPKCPTRVRVMNARSKERGLLNEIAPYVMALHQASKNAPVLAGKAGRLRHVTGRSAEHFLDVISFEGGNRTSALLAKIAA